MPRNSPPLSRLNCATLDMARVLVVYGTSEGHTARIAQAIADTLREHVSCVDVFDARLGAPPPNGYIGVVAAGSIHGGRYQRALVRWTRAHAPALNDLPTAFVSVCLAVLQHEPPVERRLCAIADAFFARVGWYPTVTTHVAGALPYTRYGFLKRQLMKRIVARAGGDVDTSRDYEYTDWADVRAFSEQFAHRLKERMSATTPIRPGCAGKVA